MFLWKWHIILSLWLINVYLLSRWIRWAKLPSDRGGIRPELRHLGGWHATLLRALRTCFRRGLPADVSGAQRGPRPGRRRPRGSAYHFPLPLPTRPHRPTISTGTGPQRPCPGKQCGSGRRIQQKQRGLFGNRKCEWLKFY